MTYHYCTLFDSFFLSRGLALYDSLKRTTPNFKLYIFPFDKKADEVLRLLQLPQVVVVSQNEFESQELLKIKEERTRGEYCWTCTPIIIEHCIKAFNLSHCTYLDADLFFFSNANQLVDSMDSQSVLITDHRYSSRYDQSSTSGRYCVQFMTFKNDDRGMTVLTWWKERCLEWCYDKLEDGKFGDQKYLDDWLVRFEGVYELLNEGAGLAPWNIQQYLVVNHSTNLTVQSKLNSRQWPVVFYHFHRLRFLSTEKVDLGSYLLAAEIVWAIYKPYLIEVENLNQSLLLQYGIGYPAQSYATKSKLPIVAHKIARWFMGVYNIFDLSEL